MNNSITIVFIIISIVKVNIKNTHSITIKYNINGIFIKVEYIFICVQSTKGILIILLVTNQSGTNFNAARKSSTALSYIDQEHISLKQDHHK